MKGAYPILAVADVQGQGSANVFNKVKLWDMLSIDKWVREVCDEENPRIIT